MDPRIQEYLEMLFKWNRAVNLTAFTSIEDALRHGVQPSLAASGYLPQGARVVDIGSGGGFPAIPLALTRPDLSFVLAEPSRAKTVFLKEIAWKYGLPVTVENKTADELLARGEAWDAATVRGLHLKRGLIKRIQRGLVPDGVLLVWTGGERRSDYEKWLASDGWEVTSTPLEDASNVLIKADVPRGTSRSRRP